MTLEQLHELLKSTGFPVAYGYFSEKQQFPYILYRVTYSNNFGADNRVYQKNSHIQVELYTKLKDQHAEGKTEQALSSLFWEKSEEYIDSEKCYQILYEIEV